MINFNRKVSHFLLSRRLVNPRLNFGLKIPIQNTRKGIVNPNFKLNPFVKPTPEILTLLTGETNLYYHHKRTLKISIIVICKASTSICLY